MRSRISFQSRLIKSVLQSLLLLLSLQIFAHAESVGSEQPVHFSFTRTGPNLYLNVGIDPDCFVYGPDNNDIGLPFSIQLNKAKSVNVKQIAVLWPSQIHKTEHVGHKALDIYGYDKDVALPLIITPIDDRRPSHLTVDLEYAVCWQNSCRQFTTALTYDCPVLDRSFSAKYRTTLIACILAILGGFILNFMPCVLPVVSLKIWQLVQYRKLSSREIRYHLMATSLGIMLSFIVIAIINIALRYFGHSIGWGLHFQNPAFIVFVIIVLWLLILNLAGLFTPHLPSFIQSRLHGLGRNEGYLGSLSSGILLTMLATPCTAPFLSTALAFALSQSSITIIAIYCFIALGLSLPYILISYKTEWLQKLPRNSKISDTIKKVLTVPLILTVVWLLYVLSQQDINPVLVLVLLILIGLACHYFRKVQTTQHNLTPLRIRYLFFAISAGLGIVAASFISLQHVLTKEERWNSFHYSDLHTLLAQGNTVFVNVMASWCLTCKVNELTVLENGEILEYFKDNKVIMLKGNYTKGSPEIAEYMAVHNRYGVPMSVVYGPCSLDGILLPEILTKIDVKHAVTRARCTK